MFTVAIYLEQMAFGGSEEGGWWYMTGERQDETFEKLRLHGAPRMFSTEAEATAWAQEVNARLEETLNKGRRPLSSVLSNGRYRALVHEGWPPEAFPERRPHYE